MKLNGDLALSLRRAVMPHSIISNTRRRNPLQPLRSRADGPGTYDMQGIYTMGTLDQLEVAYNGRACCRGGRRSVARVTRRKELPGLGIIRQVCACAIRDLSSWRKEWGSYVHAVFVGRIFPTVE
jgi:hypothetical protein